MSASQRKRVGVLAAGLSFLALGYTLAQQVQTSEQTRPDRSSPGAFGQTDRSSNDLSPTQGGQQNYGDSARGRTANFRGPDATAGGRSQLVERFLAACLLSRNTGEVQLSEIAQQKSENADVKKFAEEMIQDHKKMIEQLQPLAAMQGGVNRGVSGALGTRTETERNTTADASASNDSTALPGSADASQTTPPNGTTAGAPRLDSTADATPNVAATERMAAGGAVHQLMQIDKQINDRCLQAAKEELQQKSGAEFDKCYIGMAIGAHVHALAALAVIGEQPQSQLAQMAKQAQPTVQQHLDQAKQLMKQLEGQAGATGSTAERGTTTRTE